MKKLPTDVKKFEIFVKMYLLLYNSWALEVRKNIPLLLLDVRKNNPALFRKILG